MTRCGLLVAAVECVQACTEFFHGERLCQVIIAAGREAAHTISDAVPSRQEKHRDQIIVRTQGGHDFKAIFPWQIHIQDDCVKGLTQGGAQCFAAVCMAGNDVPALGQPSANLAREFGVIFGQEESHSDQCGRG